jgi:hypothetical protein
MKAVTFNARRLDPPGNDFFEGAQKPEKEASDRGVPGESLIPSELVDDIRQPSVDLTFTAGLSPNLTNGFNFNAGRRRRRVRPAVCLWP